MDEILSHSMDFGCSFMQSLPARGAWIEMGGVCVNGLPVAGSLPAGGRGLKFERLHQCRCDECVAPRKGSVD